MTHMFLNNHTCLYNHPPIYSHTHCYTSTLKFSGAKYVHNCLFHENQHGAGKFELVFSEILGILIITWELFFNLCRLQYTCGCSLTLGIRNLKDWVAAVDDQVLVLLFHIHSSSQPFQISERSCSQTLKAKAKSLKEHDFKKQFSRCVITVLHILA